ncbi:thioredoxin domain-containing protein [Methylovulum psychrotolerans]|uniref:Hydrogenase expression/formation protein n=1 Tax=Methylovulum psychrotolerans TaxID=1704499 RepID=A0A1Z4C3F5_9GAMM|nr:hydrogenase [Methylovulum psychrotolerans]ASF48020.1 hydrogenase [Methylovulum psychrotolerans]MBT9100208.1 hydrogenase [Methylovulum psychrotolerans]POZ51346.1 hydrogenase [Methylovulum psychrotolerans]
MSSPLLAQLTTRYGYPVLDADNYDFFVYSHKTVVLFFSNDPSQFPESNDVAVILPELLKAVGGQLQAALIAKPIERELQARFRFTGWPSLVFLRNGDYLGVITGIRDWQEFMQETAKILSSPPSIPPKFDLDRVCQAAH